MESRAATLRRFWLNVHLWIGVGLALLLVPVSLSGGLLVWQDEIDALIHPQRYAVTGTRMALPPSAYLDSARRAVSAHIVPAIVRFPDRDRAPVVVMARGRDSEGRPSLFNIYLDPPTARVLDAVDFRASFFGWLHRFHENLTIPQYSGRQIVGFVGIGMLILSLTGIWLWWPRAGGFLRGLRWQRSPHVTFNLHHLLGFWISLPLAAVSLTGIYLSFPQTARNVMSSVATMSPQGVRGGFAAQVARQTALTPDQALDIALGSAPGATPVALFLPVQSRGERGAASVWRVQISQSGSGETATVTIDDRSAKATTAVAQSGDRGASWIRWIHEGSHSGAIWSFVVFLTGLFPTIFAVTGVIMWLRVRAGRKALDDKRRAAKLSPAE